MTESDPRFTNGLMFDVIKVLEQHGYKSGSNPRCYADALVKILELVHAFEGLEDAEPKGT